MASYEQPNNKTLYVGNLDLTVTEDLITMLFGQLGEVRSCKMFRDPGSDPYCFIELGDHMTAVSSIAMMNDKVLNGKKMRVDWATGQGNRRYNKVDTTKHHHIYVGDLSPDIEEEALREAFQVFGEISDVKIVKDQLTFKSRGYGFVVFVKKMDAETAISAMNGQWLGRKMIKTRWATRKPVTTGNPDAPGPVANKQNAGRSLDYDEIFKQSLPTNTTVFCGGLKQDVAEEVLHEYFQPYGQIEKIKIFKEKGYAFIKFSSKDSACQAIVDLHNTNFNGQMIRCSWGKDTGPDGPGSGPSAGSGDMGSYSNGSQGGYGSQMGYVQYYPQQMGYNYPQMGYNQYYGYTPNMWMNWGQQQQQQQGWVGQSVPQTPGNPQPGHMQQQ